MNKITAETSLQEIAVLVSEALEAAGIPVTLKTQYGSLRIITPTQCVMDRLAWYAHGNDLQARDQAVLVAARQWRSGADPTFQH